MRIAYFLVWLGALCAQTKGASETLKCWVQVGDDLDGRAPQERFGRAVDINSDGSVIAAGTSGNGVRVFEVNETSIVQRGEDILSGDSADLLGNSVALSSDGNIVAVLASGNSTRLGFVRVLEYKNETFVRRGSDIVEENSGDFSLGTVSMSSDGNIIAVGAELNDGNGVDSGHVRVFEYDGTNYLQRGLDIEGENPGDLSGRSIDLSANGNVLAVGASNNGDAGNSSGHVRVYEFDGVNYIQRGQDIDGEAPGDLSGFSVSLSADGIVLAVGAIQNDINDTAVAAGHARVFEYNGTHYVQRGADLDGQGRLDFFGSAISLNADGSIVAVGGFLHSGGLGQGQVRVFRYDGSEYKQLEPDIDGEDTADLFGGAVALNSGGDILVVGAIGNDDGGRISGHVRVYTASSDEVLCATDSPTEMPTISPTTDPTFDSGALKMEPINVLSAMILSLCLSYWIIG